MGAQSIEIKDVYSILKENTDYLKSTAKNKYLQKYFLLKSCNEDNELKTSYALLLDKYLNPTNCTVVDYLNSKISGEDIKTNLKRKLKERISIIVEDWLCNTEGDFEGCVSSECCDWKGIEW